MVAFFALLVYGLVPATDFSAASTRNAGVTFIAALVRVSVDHRPKESQEDE